MLPAHSNLDHIFSGEPDDDFFQKPDRYQYNGRRQIQSAHRRYNAAYAAKHWFRQSIETTYDASRSRIVNIQDSESHQPTDDYRYDNKPPVGIEKVQDQLYDWLWHGFAFCLSRFDKALLA
jgi:hypothetical protein